MATAEDKPGSSDTRRVPQSLRALVRSAPLLSQLKRKQDLTRLASALALQEARFEYHRSLPTDREPSLRQADLDLRRQLLENAKDSLRQGDIDSGWKALQELEREMLCLLSPEELHARWISAILEAKSKVGDWRGNAANKLAAKFDGDRDKSIAALRETLFHIHSESQNNYYKIARLRTQIGIAAFAVIILVLATLVLNMMGFFSQLADGIEETLPLAVFSGLLGGVLSVVYTVVRADPARKIPEVRASFGVTMVRPVIGAAIALPILFVLHSGLIVDAVREWAVLGFCFVGGFSEQWFLGIVERFEKSI